MHMLRTIALVSLALLLAACNGPTKAGKEARTAARQRADKTSSLIVYDQAYQAYEAGDFEKALVGCNEAIVRMPKEARYWVLRGRVQLERARLEEALSDFRKAEEVKPDCAEAMYCQGIVHERWNKNEEAIAAYLKATTTDTTKVAYPLAAAEMMVAERQYDEAKALLEPKLSYFENNAPMHQLLGKVAMLQSDPKEAAAHFNRALLIDPKLPMILDNVVQAQFAAGQWNDCLLNVRRLERETEGGRTPDRLIMEARCLTMLGRSSDARNLFSEVTRAEPENIEAWIELAAVSWDLGETSRVQSAAQRLLRLAPNRYEGFVFLGLVEESKGHDASARQLYEKAKALAGASADVPGMLLGLHESRQATQIEESQRAGVPDDNGQ